MKNMNEQAIEIPDIEIDDPYEYITSKKTIANLVIRSRHGVRRMPFIRTKNGGYMTH